jgi:O-antigen/teichoic acid export membrane protein
VSVQKLASQTMWYGLSNILGRFLNYFLSLILIYIYKPGDIAAVSQVYVIVPFLNILFTLGLETSYFKFSQNTDKKRLFNTLNSFLIGTTILFCIVLIIMHKPVTASLDMKRNVTYYYWMVAIIAVDTLCAIPFAKLRHENKPKKFAIIKFLNICINVFLVFLFIVVLQGQYLKGTSLPVWLYNPNIGIGYFILANLAASVATFLMLLPEWKGFQIKIDIYLLKQIMMYSLPIIIVGFGGMINDFLSRIMYYKILDDPLPKLDFEFGVFIANYKLAVLATLFIQVFKMGAEPFFFAQSGSKNAPETYARVTKIFSIICCVLFLFIAMNINLFKLLIASKHPEYAQGITIVPILTLANIFLGIYYNLSVWYKVTNNTMKGAIITLIGVAFTIIFNLILVPKMHYFGAVWATFICYASMLVISYIWGQKIYKIPYDVRNILIYFGLVIGMYLLYNFTIASAGFSNNIIRVVVGGIAFIISTIVFLIVAIKLDRQEFASLPKVGKYFK